MPFTPHALLKPLAALVGLAAFGLVAAQAQTPDLDATRLQILEHHALQSQARALDAQREADAALARLQAEQTLRGLAADRAAGSAAWLAGSPPPAPAAVDPIDRRLVVDSQRIMQLQGEALARSNARILAVQPAL